jgi:hypothetical protein
MPPKGRKGGADAGKRQADNKPRDPWLCICCTNSKGARWRNSATALHCTGECKRPKGQCFGEKAGNGGSPTVSTRALLQPTPPAFDVSCPMFRQMQAEIAALKKKVAAAEAVPAMDVEGMDACDDTIGLDAAISKARSKLKDLEGLSLALRPFIGGEGGYDALVAAARSELQQALAERRAANPLKKQLEGAEAHQCKTAKRLTEAKACLQKHECELAEVLKQIDLQKAVVAEAATAAAKADAEVAGLAAKFASERSAAAQVPAGAATTEMEPTAAEGFVSIAFADQKWAEREAEFRQQLAQLRTLVEGQGEDGAALDASPSDAADLATMEQLDDDDEAWAKVGRGKRKALLHRERDVLASRVRSTIGKVGTPVSPFKKQPK